MIIFFHAPQTGEIDLSRLLNLPKSQTYEQSQTYETSPNEEDLVLQRGERKGDPLPTDRGARVTPSQVFKNARACAHTHIHTHTYTHTHTHTHVRMQRKSKSTIH